MRRLLTRLARGVNALCISTFALCLWHRGVGNRCPGKGGRRHFGTSLFHGGIVNDVCLFLKQRSSDDHGEGEKS